MKLKNDQDAEQHLFKCSLCFGCDGTTWVSIKSQDGSIDYRFEAQQEHIGMFQSGTRVVFCEGIWDNRNKMVWLGKIVPDQEW